MQPYGKSQLFVYGCKCCSANISPRQQAKRELAKLIEEETYEQYVINGQIVSDPRMFVCSVCGKPDQEDCLWRCYLEPFEDTK